MLYTHVFQEGELEREAAEAGLQIVYRSDYPDPVAVLGARTMNSVN
jgi:hypothetical protein